MQEGGLFFCKRRGTRMDASPYLYTHARTRIWLFGSGASPVTKQCPRRKWLVTTRKTRFAESNRTSSSPQGLKILGAPGMLVTKRYPTCGGSSYISIVHFLALLQTIPPLRWGTVLLQKRNMKRNRRTEIASGGRYEE